VKDRGMDLDDIYRRYFAAPDAPSAVPMGSARSGVVS
jgi:hypothetical protein